MKRVVVFLLVLASLALGSCRRATVMPEFDVIVLDTVITDNDYACTFQFTFTSIANADKSPALQAIQEANQLYFFEREDVQGDVQQMMEYSIAQFMCHNQILDENYDLEDLGTPNWRSEMELIIESDARIVDSLLVYSISRSSYTGGAHGMYTLSWHNYSIAGGYELALSDLFTPEQQESLLTLIKHKLYEQFEATGDEDLAAQGLFPEYIAATENFEVSEDGITFYYNPYDIAAYALGRIEVHISGEELKNL
ncbi:RsiV family protein [uncultured Alistipes sp.]|uniref:RsiV family protein n=1 Tax=uncultured Alistipes sp. TaxID=538949 RepID=UPI0026201CBB|nr:RsiV family protein [uncultured Alistipes sp.]